jgi:hypothetical protein
LILKAKFESGSSYFSFSRLVPGGFNVGLIGSTCTALPLAASAAFFFLSAARAALPRAIDQGLTLVHFSAQRKHVLLDTLGA